MLPIAGPVLEAALRVIGRVAAWVWRRTKARRLRKSMERRYLQSVIHRYEQWSHDYVEMRGTREGPSAALSRDITVRPAMYALVEPDEPEAPGDSPAVQQRDSKVRVDLSTIVDQVQQFVLLGEPGSGKTSLLQCLALTHAKLGENAPDSEYRLPVLIDLGGYVGRLDVVDFVKGCLRDEHGVAGAYLAENFAEYLEDGRLLFLLDGLNEMPPDGYTRCVDRLRAFADANNRNKFVFTCRVLDYEYRFGWPRVLIAPMDDEQIERFVANYLPQASAELLHHLRGEHDALFELARNPFMLRLLTLVHRQRGALPRARGRLLKEFVAVLLAREKGDSWAETTEARALLHGLERLAFMMIQDGKVGDTVGRDWVGSALATGVGREDPSPAFSVSELIKLGADASLLEVTRRQDRISYYHELLQEYFAARFLDRRYRKGEDLLPLLGNGWWEQTVVMLCGLVEGPDALLLSILERLGSERGTLLAGACCAEATALVQQETVRQVVGSLQALTRMRIGPLGIRAMDLIARIDYASIEEMVLDPDPTMHEPPDVQMVLLLGARYVGSAPVYMGPFGWANRDREWEPRAYAASLARTLGSPRVGARLVRLLNSAAREPASQVMITAVLADIRYPPAAEGLLWVVAEGTGDARIHAARGLGRICARQAEGPLTRRLLDPAESEHMREACAVALVELTEPEFVESLADGTGDARLREIVHHVLSDRHRAGRQDSSSWPDRSKAQIAELCALAPEELLCRLVTAYEQWGAETYPLTAALALRGEQSIIPQLQERIKSIDAPTGHWPGGQYKLREALWWTGDAIRERKRRRGRPPLVSPSPRDWSAFGAPPR